MWGGCRVTVDIVAEAECVCGVDVGSWWTLLLKLSACVVDVGSWFGSE